MEIYDYPQASRKTLTGRQKVILGGLGVFLAAAVAGAAMNPSIEGEAAAPALAHEKEMLLWRTEAADDMLAIGETLQGVGESADNGDLSGMQSNCQTLGAQAENAIDDHTPTPDKALTVEMEGALVDLSDASSACQYLDYDSSRADVQEMVDYIKSATEHLENAKVILKDAARAVR